MDIRKRTGVGLRSLGEHQHYRIPGLAAAALESRHRERNAREHSSAARRRRGRVGLPGRRPRGRPAPLRPIIRCSGASASASRGWRPNTRYPIVPFSMIGLDDMWDVVVDSDSAVYAPARALAVRLDVDPDLLWQLLRGLGPTPLPRPQPIYGRISRRSTPQRSVPPGRTPTAHERCETRSTPRSSESKPVRRRGWWSRRVTPWPAALWWATRHG